MEAAGSDFQNGSPRTPYAIMCRAPILVPYALSVRPRVRTRVVGNIDEPVHNRFWPEIPGAWPLKISAAAAKEILLYEVPGRRAE